MLLIYFLFQKHCSWNRLSKGFSRKTEISRDEKLHLMINNGSFEIRGELCGHFRSIDAILYPKVGILYWA